MKENSQGGDLSTLEANSQRKHPRTFRDPVERWRVQEKQKKEKWKKRKQKKVKKQKVKYRRRSLWKKCKERIANFFMAARKEEEVERKGRKSDRCPKARHALGIFPPLLCSGRFTEKDGKDENKAATGSSRRGEK